MVFTLLCLANIYTMVIKHILELKRNMNYEQRSRLSVSQYACFEPMKLWRRQAKSQRQKKGRKAVCSSHLQAHTVLFRCKSISNVLRQGLSAVRLAVADNEEKVKEIGQRMVEAFLKEGWQWLKGSTELALEAYWQSQMINSRIWGLSFHIFIFVVRKAMNNDYGILIFLPLI